MTETPSKARRIAVLGYRAVGKSSLTIQFVENHFVDSYYPTIESTFTKTIHYKNTPYSCEIIDTAGQDEYSMLNSKHAIGIHGYVFVYSVTSLNSLEMARIIRDKILNYTGTDWIPCVLVGNKSDLHMQRQVSEEEGRELANRWKCQWTEASAKQDENIDKIFNLVIEEVEKSINPGQENPKECIIL
ncbi:MAG: ras-2 [Piptocephalis tieghemiana]|nr:MAG: ras-2 [Piptocephalis tieghemiana]